MQRSHRSVVVLVGLVFAMVELSAQAAPPMSSPSSPAVATPWRFAARLDVATTSDDNVFLLTTLKKAILAAPTFAEQASGRYVDMRSASDIVTALDLSASATGKGFTGRDLTITPSVKYEWYSRNAERSSATLDLVLEQALPRRGRARLIGSLQPNYFSRNYLADAVDADASRTISPAERVYARGSYRESALRADYRRRLVKRPASGAPAAWLLVGVGYSDRAYDAPFSARDLTGPTAQARFDLDVAHGIALQTTYDLALLDGSRAPQVLLLDEPVFNEDLNGNATTTDLSVRTVRPIDRGRVEQSIVQRVTFAVAKRTEIDLSVDLRWRRFTSTETYDVANNGRRDQQTQFGAGVTRRFSKAVRVSIDGRFSTQRLNRPADLGGLGEIGDYNKAEVRAAFRITP